MNKYSIIMAVYNTESYLAEAIESVIHQTYGFDNIELILSDDGSTDGSLDICYHYRDLYPNNIKVISNSSHGVSFARNQGLDIITGDFVSFLDSDDKYEENAIQLVDDFFNDHEDEIDIVTIPMYFFDGQSGEHILNNKFKDGTRIIDLQLEWDYILNSSSCSFIKSSAIKNIRFDERLKFSEDSKVIQQILLRKKKYGVISQTKYWYRRRKSGTLSTIQNSTHIKAWYHDWNVYYVYDLIRICKEAENEVPLFIQYTIAYDILWRLRLNRFPNKMFSQEEKSQYINELLNIITSFDDDVIIQQPRLNNALAFYIISNKHHDKFEITNDGEIVLSDKKTISALNLPLHVFDIHWNDTYFYMEFKYPYYHFMNIEQPQISISVNNHFYHAYCTHQKLVEESLEIPTRSDLYYYIQIPLNELSDRNSLNIILHLSKKQFILNNIVFDKYCPISSEVKGSYCINKQYALYYDNNTLYFDKVKWTTRIALETRLVTTGINNHSAIPLKILIVRLIIRILLIFKKKPIWLISDRMLQANDNGEAFFSYLCKEKPNDIQFYFAISKHSKDFNRLREIGPVINRNGKHYKFLYLLADRIISSQLEDYYPGPFVLSRQYFMDITFRQKFIFLQHGVTKDDISSYIGREKANISGLVTTSEREYNSFLNDNYLYSKEKIWLTGFPRFDKLKHDDQNIILIAPTWRAYLIGPLNPATGIREGIDNFDKSSYFQFYKGLLQNHTLLEAARKHNYQLWFVPHPNIKPYLNLFETSDVVKIIDNIPYSELFSTCKMLVTDYSSTPFDVAYLYKPVVYCHFDKEEFFSHHTYKEGYFDYERDGFGEVTDNLEDCIKIIIEYMDKGCKIKDLYKTRINNFFAYIDRNNSERVYKKIRELDKED